MYKAKTKRVKKAKIVEETKYSKSIFESSTFIYSTLLVVFFTAPLIYNCLFNKKDFNDKDLWYLAIAVANYVGIIQGRIKANDELPVYTPSIFPGPNKEDLEPDVDDVSEYRADK